MTWFWSLFTARAADRRACLGKHLAGRLVLAVPDLVADLYALTGRAGKPADFASVPLALAERPVARALPGHGPGALRHSCGGLPPWLPAPFPRLSRFLPGTCTRPFGQASVRTSRYAAPARASATHPARTARPAQGLSEFADWCSDIIAWPALLGR